MTWNEIENLVRQASYDIQWIKEAKEFGNKYNVIIRLKQSMDRCGNDVLTIEMTHRNDPKNTVRYKRLFGTYISDKDRISSYFEYLYDKLPQVRRNRRLENE